MDDQPPRPDERTVMFRRLASQLSCLGQETRLQIMMCLGYQRSANVTELATMLAIPATAISGHLQILARANLVWSNRNGREVEYCIHPDVFGAAVMPGEAFRWELLPLRISCMVPPGEDAPDGDTPAEPEPKKGAKRRGK